MLLTLLMACVQAPRVARQPLNHEPHVTVMTYNVNFGIAKDAETTAVIGRANADLIVLQETTPEWEAVLRDRYAATWPFMTFHHCCGAGGLAVLSKTPFVEKALLPSPSAWFPALLIVADTAVGPLQVLNVHLHPPVSESGSFVSGYFSTGPVREAEISSFAAHLDAALPTVVAGDFNEPDGAAIRFLQDHGFQTALPEFSPRATTWRWPLFTGELRSRLDHVFYSATLEPLEVSVREEGRSDHEPVLAVLARSTVQRHAQAQRTPGSLSFAP